MLRLLRNPIFAVAGWALAILLGVAAIVLGNDAGDLGGTAKPSEPAEEGSTPGHETPDDEQHEFFNIVVHTLDPDRLVGVFPTSATSPPGRTGPTGIAKATGARTCSSSTPRTGWWAG